MKEIALAVRVKNKEIIEFLHANLKTKLDFCKNIITTYCDNNFSYLLIACDESFCGPCETIIKQNIIDYIESVYKINYLKSKIKKPLGDDLVFNAYIKVLSLFDRETDVNAIEKIMLFGQVFFVDSFLEFRLNPLKKHWGNLAELSTDNLAVFNSGTFLDVIKFLLNTMDNLVYKVKVICEGEKFSIYNMKNKNASVKKIADCNNSMDLITNVLNYCPNYIDIYLDNSGSLEAVDFLSNIYSNRLKIFTRTTGDSTI